MNLRSAYSTEQVSGQSRLQKTLSQNIIIINNTIFKFKNQTTYQLNRHSINPPKATPRSQTDSRLSQKKL